MEWSNERYPKTKNSHPKALFGLRSLTMKLETSQVHTPTLLLLPETALLACYRAGPSEALAECLIQSSVCSLGVH